MRVVMSGIKRLTILGTDELMAEAKQLADEVLNDGRALAKFRLMVEWQGGQADMVDNPVTIAGRVMLSMHWAWKVNYKRPIRNIWL